MRFPDDSISRHSTAARSMHIPRSVAVTLIGETPYTCNFLKGKPEQLGICQSHQGVNNSLSSLYIHCSLP